MSLVVIAWLAPPLIADEILVGDSGKSFDPGSQLAALSAGSDAGPTAGEVRSLAGGVVVDPLTGAASTSIQIVVPPGRKDATPSLSVAYNSSAGNGVLGNGWSFPAYSIKRDTARGVPFDYALTTRKYDDARGFILQLGGSSLRLDVPTDVAGNCWAATYEETWISACLNRTQNSWFVETKDGKVVRLGAVSNARTGFDITNPDGTFAWEATSVEDPDGNDIAYTYESSVAGSMNSYSYLRFINYGGNKNVASLSHFFQVEIEYAPTRPDPIISYRGGFREEILKRVDAIHVRQTNPATPIRTYHFAYHPEAGTNRSLLDRVSLELPAGQSGTPPDVTFNYSEGLGTFSAEQYIDFRDSDCPLGCLQQPPANATLARNVGWFNPIGWVDINRDGRLDLVSAEPLTSSLQYFENRTTASGGVMFRRGDWAPVARDSYFGPLLGSARMRVVDMNGDGWPDVLYSAANFDDDPYGVEFNSPDTWRVFLNRNGVLDSTPTPWPGVPSTFQVLVFGYLPFPSPTGGVTPHGDLVDLTGDGMPDLVDCAETSNGCRVHVNLGEGLGFGPPLLWSETRALDSAVTAAGVDGTFTLLSAGNTILRHIDMNGDGLADVVNSAPAGGSGEWKVSFNNGLGFDPPVTWQVPGNTAVNGRRIENASYTTGASTGIRDLNGDGRPDAVSGSGGGLVNGGSGFGAASSPNSPQYNDGMVSLRYVDPGWLSTANVSSDYLDLNGDGMADKLRLLPSGSAYFMGVSYRQGVRPGLMTAHDNGLGAVATISYSSSTDAATAGSACVGGAYEDSPCQSNAECGAGGTCKAGYPATHGAPFGAWRVRDVAVNTGMPGPGNQLATRYTYSSPYWDASSGEFRGYRESIEERLADGRKLRRRFAPAPFTATGPSGASWPVAWARGAAPSVPFRLVDEQVIDASSHVLVQRSQDWGAVALASGRQQIHLTKTVEKKFAFSGAVSSSQTVVRTFASYDAYNNPTSETVESGTAGEVDPVTTTAAYADPNCHALPTRIAMSTGGAAGPVWSLREFGYSSTCNLLYARQYLAPSGQSAAGGVPILSVQAQYLSADDAVAAAVGLPTRVTDARGNVTRAGYSCSNYTQPCTVTNSLNQTVSRTFDLRFGQPATVTDANGATATFAYDGLGRATAIVRPLESGTCGSGPCVSRRIDYVFGGPGSPSRVEVRDREPLATDGYRLGVSFFDSIGRSLSTKEQRLVGGVGKDVIVGAVTFDVVGRVAKKLAPFESALTTASLATYEPAPNGDGTSTAFDALDRPVRVTNPDGTFQTMDYSVAGRVVTADENYNERSVSPSTPPKQTSGQGRVVVSTSDSLGRLKTTQLFDGSEASGTLVTETRQAYDALNRTTQIVYEDGVSGSISTTSFFYDSFGRRTKMVDPNTSGDWTYQYDTGGNLTFQDDPKTGQSVVLCYDALNRITRKRYQTSDTPPSAGTYAGLCDLGTTPTGRYSSYTYDTGVNAVGRLVQVVDVDTDGSATTAYEYDGRGRIVSEALGRDVPTVGLRSWTTSIGYDAADRPATERYPTNAGGFQYVSYLYGTTGQLQAITTPGQAFAANVTYDIFGRRASWEDGSGLVHRTQFGGAAQNFRLSALDSYDPVAGGPDTASPYTDLTYQYDAAGNPLAIADVGAAPSAIRKDWQYHYDGVGRLTWARKGSAGADTFGYDGLGNMSAGNGVTRIYAGSKPNQMTSMSGQLAGTPQYDANGALTSMPGGSAAAARTIGYDQDGRAELVAGGGHSVRSLYDFRGDRVARVVDEGTATARTTLYFGRRFEVSGATLTRHIYLGGQLIAESPIELATGDPLRVARASTGERILLARMLEDGLRRSPNLYPVIALRVGDAVGLGGLLLVIVVGTSLVPGRARVGYLGKVRRGRVGILLVVFVVSLTPLPLARPAEAGGPPVGWAPPPSFPVFFVHGDHLGSTTVLTCHKQPTTANCADRQIYRYLRYDAYGKATVHNASGTALSTWDTPTDRSYTGQVWDASAGVYHYGARIYEPKLIAFASRDPVRQFPNPYAYVGWGPVRYSDPTGMMFGPASFAGIDAAEELNRNQLALAFERNLMARGMGTNNGVGAVGGSREFGGSFSGGAGSPLQSVLAAIGVAVLGLAAALLVASAFVTVPAELLAFVTGGVSGFLAGGLSTRTWDGAVAGAGPGALFALGGAGLAAKGLTYVVGGVLNGVGGAFVSAASQMGANGTVDGNVVGLSGLLSVATGLTAPAAGSAFWDWFSETFPGLAATRGAAIGGSLLTILDSLYAAVGPSPPVAGGGGPGVSGSGGPGVVDVSGPYIRLVITNER